MFERTARHIFRVTAIAKKWYQMRRLTEIATVFEGWGDFTRNPNPAGPRSHPPLRAFSKFTDVGLNTHL
jgi:hypothetical protein